MLLRMRSVAGGLRGGRCGTGVRWVVLGAEEEEYERDVRGVPEYAERAYRRTVLGDRSRRYDAPHTDFDSTTVQAEMFEAAERNFSSPNHRRRQERDRQTPHPLHDYRRKTQTAQAEERFVPKRGTQIILQRYESNQVTGWNDDGLQREARRQTRSLAASGARALYRSFWRLVFRFPPELRQRLARYLRAGFKRGMHVRTRRQATASLQLGKQIFLKYSDVLTRFEERRYLHDPVARFRHFEAEEMEKFIDGLDFFPYTAHTNEMKPIKDIGFHKVFKLPRHVGSPGWKLPNSGLGRNVTRTFCQRKPRSPLLNKNRGRPLAYLGHSNRASHWIRVHNRKHQNQPDNPFSNLFGG